MALVTAIFLAVFVLPPAWRVPAIVGGVLIEVAESVFWIWLSRRRPAQTGREALVGSRGTVVSACRPSGTVRVAGELWQARCDDGADPGTSVRVTGLEGLTLLVQRDREVDSSHSLPR